MNKRKGRDEIKETGGGLAGGQVWMSQATARNWGFLPHAMGSCWMVLNSEEI